MPRWEARDLQVRNAFKIAHTFFCGVGLSNRGATPRSCRWRMNNAPALRTSLPVLLPMKATPDASKAPRTGVDREAGAVGPVGPTGEQPHQLFDGRLSVSALAKPDLELPDVRSGHVEPPLHAFPHSAIVLWDWASFG